MDDTPFLVMPGSEPSHFPIRSDIVSIGRSPDNLVHIDDPEVSRLHARVERHGNSTLLTDLNSSNGTFVNGSRIVGTVELFDGDVLGFAGVQVEFHTAYRPESARLPVQSPNKQINQAGSRAPNQFHNAPTRHEPGPIPAPPPTNANVAPPPGAPSRSSIQPNSHPGAGPAPVHPSPSAAGPPPEAALEPTDGPPLLLAKQQTRLGRLPDNDIVLADDTFASHHHARIIAQGDGQFVVIDEGSANGTFVNGTPVVEPFQLEPGDEILIGTSSFFFRRLAPVNKKRKGQPRAAPSR